jgi:hypothetical protein
MQPQGVEGRGGNFTKFFKRDIVQLYGSNFLRKEVNKMTSDLHDEPGSTRPQPSSPESIPSNADQNRRPDSAESKGIGPGEGDNPRVNRGIAGDIERMKTVANNIERMKTIANNAVVDLIERADAFFGFKKKTKGDS